MPDSLTLQFSTTFAWQSHVIRVMCHSPFSHVDVVLPEGLLGASDPGGVAVRPVDYEPFKVRQRAVITTPKADAIIARIKSQLGKPFDAHALTAFLATDIPRAWADPGSWFCSELIAWALEAEGFWPYRLIIPKNRISPADLLMLLSPSIDPDEWDKSKIEEGRP
jgi:hypothetical protein